MSGQVDTIEPRSQPVRPESDQNAGAGTEISKKPLSFWLSFGALNITVFIVSLDSTALAVAVPVCSDQVHAMSNTDDSVTNRK